LYEATADELTGLVASLVALVRAGA
jgi:hypothetical protein